jgi:hypothetical protein
MVPKRRINDESSFSRFTWISCLSWSGHQIHIALPINKLDAGVAPQEIPLPHEF